MKQKLLLILLFLGIGFGIANAKKSYRDNVEKYDIEAESVGQQGTYLVHVYVYGKRVKDEDLVMAAVHGVIFRGIPGKQGIATQRALAQSVTVETEKADYFEAFFSGPYSRFGSIVNGTQSRVKTKGGTKLGAVVQVSKDDLRRELEQAGVIRKLGAGF